MCFRHDITNHFIRSSVRIAYRIFRTEVALEYRPPLIRSRITPENFHLESHFRLEAPLNIGRKITIEKHLLAAA